MSFLPIVTAVVGVVSTAVGAVGQYMTQKAAGQAAESAAQTQASVYAYNQKIAEYNAAQARESAALQEKQYRYKAEKVMAANRAAYGKAGVIMEGTPLEVQAENAAQLEFNAQAIRYQGELEAWNQLNQANLYGAYGKAALQGGEYAKSAYDTAAGTTLLTAGLSTVGQGVGYAAKNYYPSTNNPNVITVNSGYWGSQRYGTELE